jgi:hypothetical protein
MESDLVSHPAVGWVVAKNTWLAINILGTVNTLVELH